MSDDNSYYVVPEDKLEWNNNSRKSKRSQGVSEDEKLELRLGPPGDDDHQHQSQSLLSHHHHQASNYNNNHNHIEAKRVFEEERNWLSSKLDTNNYCQNLSSYYNNNNYSCNIDHSKVEKVFATHQWLQQQQHSKPSIFIPSPSTTTPATATATASKFPNSAAANCCSKKRTVNAHAHAPAPVVGWPPVRSFRKNLGNRNFISKTDKPPDDINEESAKTSMALQEGGSSDITIHDHDERKCEGSSENDHMFVKINMEGVPIGRKVDLKAYDSYHKLSCAIDQLFRDLVSKQEALNHQYCLHSNFNANANNGVHEYTLVYEDNEGDRMLAGDVPWQMFVSTAKRLRVLKSSEVSTLRLGSSQHEKIPLDDATMEIGR